MAARPASEITRTIQWRLALVALLLVLVFLYLPLLRTSALSWLKADYSHGFLVPLFAGYLIWTRRAMAPKTIDWPNVWGLSFLTGGVLLYLTATWTNLAKETVQGISLVLDLIGVALLLGGWGAVRWLWPALAFLLFMFPLPDKVEHYLGWYLQNAAARSSAFALQTVGYPTYRSGVVLEVKDHTLGVERACSGLSMLLTFVAMSVAIVLVVRRPWLDKILILLSAIPIAVISNVIRIVVTGILYNEAGKDLGDKVFHDFAGWLMMPIALGIFWLELKLIDWVLLEDLGNASREEVIRMTTRGPSHLFMTQMEPPAPGLPR